MESILTALKVGQSGHITKLDAAQPAYRQKLLSMGLLPGAAICVTRYAPLGDPIEITVRGTRVSLRKAEANLVWVKITESTDNN